MAELDFHEVAAIFPMMDNPAFSDLKQDILENGLLEPLWLMDGKILDGRNRYKACKELGIEPTTREWIGPDPVKFVVSMNLKRRHLNESQRGMVAARIANLIRGRSKANGPIGPFEQPTESISQSDAARTMNVSRTTVKRANVILKAAPKEVIESVERGDMSVSGAIVKLVEEGHLDRKAPLTSSKRVLMIQNSHKEKMVRGLSTINGICIGLEDINLPAAIKACSAEDITQWSRKADSLGNQLMNFAKKLLNERRDAVNG